MVTLGGCHLLDGLKAVDTVEHRFRDCARALVEDCEGSCVCHRGISSQRGTLVDR